MDTRTTMKHRRRAIAGVATGAMLIAAGGAVASRGHGPGNGGHVSPAPACDTSITLPSGFCATVFADGIVGARHLTTTPSGQVFVAVADARDGSRKGGVVGLFDRNGDGKADRMSRFGTTGGNGIAYKNGYLYFAPNDGVVRYRVAPWSLSPMGGPRTIVSGLPADGDHVAKSIALDGRHGVYVNIGSASNSCQVQNRVPQSPGVDPCPELDVRAGIWKFDSTRTGQTAASGDRIAKGVRNAVALAVEPERKNLFAVQNGRDQLFENWPNIYTAADDLQKPGEELFRIKTGRDYGWPYCYFDPKLGTKVLAPEYGGNGTAVGRCADVEQPLVAFPAHWAPLSMAFTEGKRMPRKYRDGAFVAFHGSRFDPVNQPEGPGYNVAFVPFRNGKPTGEWKTFAGGFERPGTPTPDGAAHRPVGLAVARDGALYVSDDKGGRIWRISYGTPRGHHTSR